MEGVVKRFLFFAVFLLYVPTVFGLDVSVQKIWDAAPHSAFTDIIRFGDAFYCTFREGTGHVPTKTTGVGDGEIRVIRSKDGTTWESVALLTKKGYDLRDSKISTTPDGRLMLVMGGSVYTNGVLGDRLPHVSFSDKNGENFDDPVPIQVEPSIRTEKDWLWRVTWHKGTGYGVIYRARGSVWDLGIVKTTDGIRYTSVKEIKFPEATQPNEATIRFDAKDNMCILLRCEGKGVSGKFAVSPPPYSEWDWKDTGKKLGGPDFVILPSGKMLAGSRTYDNGVTTALYRLDADGKMTELVRFPGGGDTSYPGFTVYDGYVWVSYYSGHEGKTSIYLAKVKLDDVEKAME